MFCHIFGVEVNLKPTKTCAVAFRKPGTSIHRGAVLTFGDVEITFQAQYKHLGMMLHATRGIQVAVDALAESADKALKAVQARCRALHLTQLAFRCRLFDTLVEPILSYGSHVWGPCIVSKKQLWKEPCKVDTTADKLHIDYLRHLSGAGTRASIDVLLMDFDRLPIWVHWVALGVRWLHKLQDMRPLADAQGLDTHSTKLAFNVWLADIDLCLDNCTECWTSSLLHVLGELHVLPVGFTIATADQQQILSLHVDESAVLDALRTRIHDGWRQGLCDDPRGAPSLGVHMCTYKAWVRTSEQDSAPHLTCFTSFKMLQCLCKFRIGWHQLRVQTDHSLPRNQRHCKLCSTPHAPFRVGGNAAFVEDLLHFLLECPAYNHIRRAYPAVFQLADMNSPNGYMRQIFASEHQQQLAACLYTMDLFRKECLKLPAGTHVPVGRLTGVVKADIELIKVTTAAQLAG